MQFLRGIRNTFRDAFPEENKCVNCHKGYGSEPRTAVWVIGKHQYDEDVQRLIKKFGPEYEQPGSYAVIYCSRCSEGKTRYEMADMTYEFLRNVGQRDLSTKEDFRNRVIVQQLSSSRTPKANRIW